MQRLLIGITMLLFAIAVSGGEDETLLYGGLSWSPSGRYLAYATIRLSKVPGLAVFPLILSTAVHVAPSGTITVVDYRAKPVCRIRVDLKQWKATGWTADDKLLIMCDSGTERDRYILLLYSPVGRVLERKVLDEDATELIGAVSPNGLYLAYLMENGGASSRDPRCRVVIRYLEDLRIAAALQVDTTGLVDHITWSSDSRCVAAVGGEFIWLCNLDPINRPTTQQVRRTEYYGGKVSLDRDILVNASREGLGIIPVQEPERLAHYAVGDVDKFAFSPRADGTFAALVWSNGDRSEAGGGYILVLGTITISGVHIQKELARGTISDFCWHPDGNKIAYLTEEGKVVITEVSAAR